MKFVLNAAQLVAYMCLYMALGFLILVVASQTVKSQECENETCMLSATVGVSVAPQREFQTPIRNAIRAMLNPVVYDVNVFDLSCGQAVESSGCGQAVESSGCGQLIQSSGCSQTFSSEPMCNQSIQYVRPTIRSAPMCSESIGSAPACSQSLSPAPQPRYVLKSSRSTRRIFNFRPFRAWFSRRGSCN